MLASSPLTEPLKSLRPIGAMLFAVGVVLLLVQRLLFKTRAPKENSAATAKQPRASRHPKPSSPADRPSPQPQSDDRQFVDNTSVPAQSTINATAGNGGPGADPSPLRWSPELLSRIEWRRFEAFVEALLQMSGFETRSQSHGADGGVDIWLHARAQPDTPIGIVQCKHWNGKRVGVDKVRELRGVMASLGLPRGQFATTSTFTADAIEFASRNNIHLLDAQTLLRLVGKRTEEQRAALLAIATEGEYWRPTCASCGIKLVERRPRNGGKAFWGCANYPRCRTSMPMRGSAESDAAVA
ncbi:MAG: restriction endonuclease [Limnobacter sp.]|nr:restriction endonuclease [Limnobacter sp.]